MALEPHNSSYLGTNPPPAPKLVLSETELFFELALNGDRTDPQTVEVTNTSSSTVGIRAVAISSGSRDFSLEDTAYPNQLLAGESFDITVDFEARVDGVAVGTVEVYTNEDRLPYVVNLRSRTQRVPVFSDLYAQLQALLTAEATTRSVADQSEATARTTLNTTLRALIASTNAIEASYRGSADTALGIRVSNIEAAAAGTSSFLTLLEEETDNRIIADAAEASYRLLLANTINDALDTLNTSLSNIDSVWSTNLGVQVGRVDTIEAAYQTTSDVLTIANARVAIETAARVNAVSAEATNRLTLEATLRGETTTGLSGQAAIYTAALTVEQIARVALGVATTVSFTQLRSRTSNGRGITPNGTFEAGSDGWTGTVSFIADVNGRISAISAMGQYQTLKSAEKFRINLDRAYQVNCGFQVLGASVAVYIGVNCYDDEDTFLGTIYGAQADGDIVIGTHAFTNILSGHETYPIPTTRTGNKFPDNTTKIELVGLMNYPSPDPVVTGYGKFNYLWLEDITNANAVDARLTSELITQSDVNGAFASRLDTAEANYTSARSDIDDLDDENTDRIADIVAANARITTEITNRANAVLAEASRIDTVLASYSTTGAVNTLISAAVTVEATARASAIAGVLAFYGVTLDVNGYITGFSQFNNGTSGEFIVKADKFKVAMPGEGSYYVFGVDATGVQIAGDLYMGNGRIITVAGTYRKVEGAAFGHDSNLLEWWGLNSIALGSETPANCKWALSTDGKFYLNGVDIDVTIAEAAASGGTASANIFSVNTTAPHGATVTGYSGAIAVTPSNFSIHGEFSIISDTGGDSTLYIELVKPDTTVITVFTDTYPTTTGVLIPIDTAPFSLGITGPEIWTLRVRLTGGTGAGASHAISDGNLIWALT